MQHYTIGNTSVKSFTCSPVVPTKLQKIVEYVLQVVNANFGFYDDAS